MGGIPLLRGSVPRIKLDHRDACGRPTLRYQPACLRALRRGGRRRGIRCIAGSVPPRAAKRRALSRAISASSPARTTAVFSSMPLSRVASFNNASSIFSVVLICIYMHYTGIAAPEVNPLVSASCLVDRDAGARPHLWRADPRPACGRIPGARATRRCARRGAVRGRTVTHRHRRRCSRRASVPAFHPVYRKPK